MTYRLTKAWAGAVAALTACAVLAACGSSDPASGSGGSSGGGDTTLTLYNGQHIQTAQSLIAAFEKKTGIKVQIRSDDEGALANQIAAEGGNSPADVIYTENSPPLENLQNRGLLAAVDPVTLAHTPSQYNSAQGDWVGVSGRVSVLVYNPRLITAKQLPKKISELAKPRYKGKLALAPQETDFQPIVTAYNQAYGKAATLRWLAGVKANMAGHVYPDNETVTADVNKGAIAFGLINQYYWWRMRAEIGTAKMHSRLALLAPQDPGYIINVSGAAVLKSSKNSEAAQKFLAFLVGKDGQEIIAHPGTGPNQSLSFEYPLASGVTTTVPEVPFSSLKPYQMTMGDLGTGAGAIALLRQAGLL
jgi:iron(III) transport system substrate-binding protein